MCNNCGCGNSDGCGGCGDDHGHDDHGQSHGMNCCEDHATSKEHLEMKKKMLEEKLALINEQLGKDDDK